MMYVSEDGKMFKTAEECINYESEKEIMLFSENGELMNEGAIDEEDVVGYIYMPDDCEDDAKTIANESGWNIRYTGKGVYGVDKLTKNCISATEAINLSEYYRTLADNIITITDYYELGE